MEQLQYQYDYNTELLMKRIADASQCKIYPAVVPKSEIPLRKVLLTTRLWNDVRRQQALFSMATEDWLFNQQQQSQAFVYNTEEEETTFNDIPIPTTTTNTEEETIATDCLITGDWTWSSPQESLKRTNDDLLEQPTYKKPKTTTSNAFDNLMNNILVSSA